VGSPAAAPYRLRAYERLHRGGRRTAVVWRWARERMKAMGDVVLIADDDLDIVRFVALNLRLEGFEVVAAHDGQDALDKALDVEPSLILLDTVMPRMDGYEVCSRLRDQRPRSPIPVIMLTAKSLAADRAKAFTAGADDWVTKPFDPADLVSKVKHRLHVNAPDGW
jgi:DNA-binding response OmpR family regulator